MMEAVETWPGWPIRQALVAIEADLTIHAVDYFVRPPEDWPQCRSKEAPAGLGDELAKLGVQPRQAAHLLNAVLGEMRPFTTGSGVHLNRQAAFERGTGVKMRWALRHFFTTPTATNIRIDLGNHAHADIDTTIPTDGSLLERAVAWAEGYVTAHGSVHLFRAMQSLRYAPATP